MLIVKVEKKNVTGLLIKIFIKFFSLEFFKKSFLFNKIVYFFIN